MADRPQIPELTWRVATVDDAAALAHHQNACAEADGLPERMSEEGYAHELAGPDADLDTKSLLAIDSDGRIAARCGIWLRSESAAERRAYVDVTVAPSWRGRGLARYLSEWGIRRCEELLHDPESSAQAFVCSWLYEQQEDQISLMRSLGLEPVRFFHEMERPLDGVLAPPRRVDGIDVARWGPEHDQPIRLVSNAAFADHWGTTPLGEDSWKHHVLDDPHFRRDLSFVAMHGPMPVGYAKNALYPEDWEAAGRSEGWIESLGVLADYRGRGIASALLEHTFAAFHREGLEAAMLGVDTANPTGAFVVYERVGFTTLHKAVTLQKVVGS